MNKKWNNLINGFSDGEQTQIKGDRKFTKIWGEINWIIQERVNGQFANSIKKYRGKRIQSFIKMSASANNPHNFLEKKEESKKTLITC